MLQFRRSTNIVQGVKPDIHNYRLGYNVDFFYILPLVTLYLFQANLKAKGDFEKILKETPQNPEKSLACFHYSTQPTIKAETPTDFLFHVHVYNSRPCNCCGCRGLFRGLYKFKDLHRECTYGRGPMEEA